MSDDALIEAMWRAYIANAGPVPIDPMRAMRAVLAVVRAHDRDGARWRWFRRHVCIIDKKGFMGASADRYAAFEFLDVPFPTYIAPDAAAEFDAAIDAAMRAEG